LHRAFFVSDALQHSANGTIPHAPRFFANDTNNGKGIPMASSNLQAELRELREQMNDLKDMIGREAGRSSRTVRNRASEVLDEAGRAAASVTGYTSDDVRNRASDVVNGAAHTAHVVADYARDGADTVAGVVRRHPAAATSAGLLTLGIVGGIVGYLLANSTPPARDSRWRWN
jgi:ElaB/YqjD/DUF883 family membrane-anchored ribosome-binding protein